MESSGIRNGFKNMFFCECVLWLNTWCRDRQENISPSTVFSTGRILSERYPVHKKPLWQGITGWLAHKTILTITLFVWRGSVGTIPQLAKTSLSPCYFPISLDLSLYFYLCLCLCLFLFCFLSICAVLVCWHASKSDLHNIRISRIHVIAQILFIIGGSWLRTHVILIHTPACGRAWYSEWL